MSTIYFVHAATSVGRVVVRADSHATIDEALSEAASALSSGICFRLNQVDRRRQSDFAARARSKPV